MTAALLRTYQTAALDRVDGAIATGTRGILLVLPTGAGKTVTASEAIRRHLESGGTILFLVHRRELTRQAVQKLNDLGVDPGIIQAGFPTRPNAKVRVASVQTLHRRAIPGSKIELPPATMVIVDEAHHSPPLPAGALPSSIEDFARDAADRMGVEAGMIALPCLVVAAACLHDGFTLQPRRHDTGWTESPRLWLGIVADPGGKKSPALEAALKPLRKIEHTWSIDDRRLMDVHAFAMDEFTRRKKDYRPPEHAADFSDAPIAPQKPPQRRKLAGDATMEALGEILTDNDGGILSFHDELAGLFGGFDAYRPAGQGKDRAHWLELYNGGPHAIDRVNRGRVSVLNWSACLLGGVQPERLRSYAGKLSDDGLAQRFVFLWGDTTGAGQDREPDRRAMWAYQNLLAQLVSFAPAATHPPVTLSEGAHIVRQRVAKFAGDMLTLPSTPPAFRGHLAKWGGLFARLLLICHAVKCAEMDMPPCGAVDGATAVQVERLMMGYLMPHTSRVYRELLGISPGAAHARWIAGFVLAHRMERVTARDVIRAYNDLREDRVTVGWAMVTLEMAGWCKPVDRSNGKDVKAWDINPLVHYIFRARGETERTRRAAEQEKIRQAAAAINARHDAEG